VAMRTCGFAFTTTGRPCANHVSDDDLYCRAGHLCATVPARRRANGHASDVARRVELGGRVDINGRIDFGKKHGHRLFPMPTPMSGSAVPDRRRRANEMLARALSHEDAEADGICADRVLADPAVALALLGSPDADPAARDAVVQRFGLVGALLVIGHEDRWRRHVAALSDDAETTPVGAEVSGHVERLVKNFGHFDAERLEAVLSDIDRAEGAAPTDRAAAARRRLHAAYAIAARDGSDVSHQQYMESLNEVLLTTRPAVAS
jgi:hypothetical protein